MRLFWNQKTSRLGSNVCELLLTQLFLPYLNFGDRCVITTRVLYTGACIWICGPLDYNHHTPPSWALVLNLRTDRFGMPCSMINFSTSLRYCMYFTGWLLLWCCQQFLQIHVHFRRRQSQQLALEHLRISVFLSPSYLSGIQQLIKKKL